MTSHILVTGATGVVGSQVLSTLLAQGCHVRGASRAPARPGWAHLDFERPQTFDAALDGAGTVMLIARPGDERADRLAAPFIAAMARHGVRKACVLSALGAGLLPEFSLRRVELLVEQSGIDWVHVRPNFFMQTLAQPPLSDELRDAGTLSLPLGRARVAYVDARDVADLMVKALTDPALRNVALELNGPQALTHDEVVAQIAAACGTPMRFVNLADDEARALLLARGFTPEHTERLMRFYSLIRNDWCASEDKSCAALLGRPLRTFAAFAAAHSACWSANQGR